MACIYRHLKPNGEVFYIGIGNSTRRATSKIGRSKFWHAVTTKYPNYEVQILKNDLEWNEACELEVILIDYYGRRDLGTGTLVNMSCGAGGPRLLTELQKLKISKANKNKTVSQETRQKMSLASSGKKKSNEHRKSMSIAKSGIKYSDETNAKKACKMGANGKAIPVEYNGVYYSCKKEFRNAIFPGLTDAQYKKAVLLINLKIIPKK